MPDIIVNRIANKGIAIPKSKCPAAVVAVGYFLRRKKGRDELGTITEKYAIPTVDQLVAKIGPISLRTLH